MPQKNMPRDCPMEVTIDLIGGKYKALILWHLRDSILRFTELKSKVPQSTAKMLTQQLRELEEDLLIARKIYPVVPPKVEYSLTELGKTLIPVLSVMCRWGKEYAEKTNSAKFIRGEAPK